MAHVYAYSGAVGAGTGVDWANAYTTWKAAAEAAGTLPGDNVWLAHDHAETTAAVMTITNKNTEAQPGTVMCVNRAGSVPPTAADLATTASITTTGNSTLNLNGVNEGITYVYGVTFNVGTGAVNATLELNQSAVGWVFQNCKFKKLGTTGVGNALDFASVLKLINVTVQFGAVGDSIRLAGAARFEWRDTPNAIEGAIFPTTLFAAAVGGQEKLIHGVDFSAMTGTLVGNFVTTAYDVKFVNCKINAASVISAAQGNLAGSRVWLVNCDSGSGNYRNEYYRHVGVQTTETTIVHSGGGSDGVTPVSWKIVTTVDSEWLLPFESLPMTVWNDATGVKTVSVFGYWANASPPNNDDIWIEAAYPSDAASPLSATASSGKASFIATNAAIPTDGSTWGGGATTTRFKMSCTLTAAQKGPITVTVKAAKASSTFYIDPKVVIT